MQKFLNRPLFHTCLLSTRSSWGVYLWIDKNRSFSTQSLSFDLASWGNTNYFHLYKSICKDKFPKKVKFVFMEFSKLWMNTHDHLQWRSPWLSISPNCHPFCKNASITQNHLSITFQHAPSLWGMCLSILGWYATILLEAPTMLAIAYLLNGHSFNGHPFKRKKKVI